jgi:hypothetical protein
MVRRTKDGRTGAVRAMPQFIPYSPQEARTARPPLVRLALRGSDGKETRLEFRQDTIVIGTASGCDVQLPGGRLPLLVAVASVVSEGLHFRALQPGLPFHLNGQSADEVTLRLRDEWSCGEYHLRLDFLSATTLSSARDTEPGTTPPEIADLKAQFERERQEWEAEAESQAEALAVRTRAVQETEKQLADERKELEELKASLKQPVLPPDFEAVRGELMRLRDSLYQQYRQRRDAVVALRDAVRHAAAKVQQEKRQLREESAQFREIKQKITTERSTFSEQQAEVAKQARLVEEWQQELQRDQQDLAQQRATVSRQQCDLETKTRELQDDLVRSQRLHESLHRRKADLDRREEAVRELEAYWQAEGPKLAAGRSQLEQAAEKIKAQAQIQAEQEQELATHSADLLQQRESLKTTDADLAARAAKLTEWERQLGQDRLRLDRLEDEITQRREHLIAEQERWLQEEMAWKQRQQRLEQEVLVLREEAARYHQLQAQRESYEEELATRRAALEEAEAAASQRNAFLLQRTERLLRVRHRLHQQRQALREQLQIVVDSEHAHETLQEQLRRRTAALAQREAEQQRLEATYQQRLADAEAGTMVLAEQKQAWEVQVQQERESLDVRRAALDEQAIQLQKDRETLAILQQQLADSRQQLDDQRRLAGEARQHATDKEHELEQAKGRLLEALPALMRSAETALERLGQARSQLRTQLQEIHAYRQRCHDEIESRRREAAQITQQLDERYQVVLRLQDEQRLEAAALRQDCLQWQAQVEQLQSQWSDSQRHLAEQADRIASQAKALEQNTSRLEVRAEELDTRERDVAYRRTEVNRHLADMQYWYRAKLRDMAEKKLPHHGQPGDEELYDPPHILQLKSTRTNTDAHLADLLSGMGLVDAVTLQTLLEEARQQRVSLRDCLVQNEFLTAYQMELIEAGRLEALVLGPLRVIDRVRTGAMETIYRVFDPRQGDEALLRHLSAAVDPNWQQEYRTLFEQAARIRHPSVAATIEVLEMGGSPAVLQEWQIGLPGTEWAGLITEPFVALKLILQAAGGLAAIHQEDLVHGQLHLGRLLLTLQGDLKVCGAGEPRWLGGLASTHEVTPQEDLTEFAKIILPWCRGKPRPPGALAEFIKKLEAGQYQLAEQLSTAAYSVLRSLPPDEAAWQRLLDFVQERLTTPEPVLHKKSA